MHPVSYRSSLTWALQNPAALRRDEGIVPWYFYKKSCDIADPLKRSRGPQESLDHSLRTADVPSVPDTDTPLFPSSHPRDGLWLSSLDTWENHSTERACYSSKVTQPPSSHSGPSLVPVHPPPLILPAPSREGGPPTGL